MVKEKKIKPAFSKQVILSSLIFFLLLFACQHIFTGCKVVDPEPDPEPGLKITGISIPSKIHISIGEDFVITGKGFKEEDLIELTSNTEPNTKHNIEISSVTNSTATFILPKGVVSDSYRITVFRGLESQLLGTVFINITLNIDIPDIEGMTVKGLIYCNGTGIPGVVVSDGIEVTISDEDGKYYLPSKKKNGYVFISIPGNYEVSNNENLPQFFQRLVGGNSVEQKDFSLIETDNSKHVVLTMADWHLADRSNDVAQFNNGFLQDINATIAAYQSIGTKVYGLTLGDMTWDLFWYSNNFALPEYLIQMKKINCTIFNLMGNHDNDPYKLGDWLAEKPYKDIICPTYYSFNLGDVHYVVLDNIEYINQGGSEGVIGDREFNNYIVPDQMKWLERDLATISDPNTPIVIGVHAPIYRQPIVDKNGNYTPDLILDNGSSFSSLLERFNNVHILSGHTHKNYTVELSESLIEHNTAAVCATWWWTGRPGYADNHICRDGSPGGYGIWEMNDKEQEWYYKSIGYDRNYQFRAYDLNTIHISAENFAPNSSDALLAEYAAEYASPSVANEVLLNVWGYDSSWEIKITENGNELDVSQFNGKDPLHIISYEALRLNYGATPTSSFITTNTPHLFKAKASNPTSTLEIEITDRFGNVYKETMQRPKTFTHNMY